MSPPRPTRWYVRLAPLATALGLLACACPAARVPPRTSPVVRVPEEVSRPLASNLAVGIHQRAICDVADGYSRGIRVWPSRRIVIEPAGCDAEPAFRRGVFRDGAPGEIEVLVLERLSTDAGPCDGRRRPAPVWELSAVRPGLVEAHTLGWCDPSGWDEELREECAQPRWVGHDPDSPPTSASPDREWQEEIIPVGSCIEIDGVPYFWVSDEPGGT